MPSISAHFLPKLVSADALAGGTVMAMDVLRATTTITYALAAGATRVIPCGEIDEARATAERIAAETGQRPLLGGERHGLPIEGFDLGNSPRDFTPARVGGRTLVFTTTNGTRAMLHCRQAAGVVLAAMVNLRAVVEHVRGVEQLHLLCAGTEGEVTREDVLAAGGIVYGLTQSSDRASAAPPAYILNDEARLALDAWRAALPAGGSSSDKASPDEASPAWLLAALAESRGGRNLHRIGLARDLTECAALDRFNIVPALDLAAWEIRVR